jgi:uncharacterized membrane protein
MPLMSNIYLLPDFIWGYKLLAYINLAAGVCEIPMLAYTKSPEKAKASLF